MKRRSLSTVEALFEFLTKLLLSKAYPRWCCLAAFLIFGLATQAFGQGCTQCLDSTRATPPAVQAAYRHAIFMLGGSGAAVFAVGTLLLRRNR